MTTHAQTGQVQVVRAGWVYARVASAMRRLRGLGMTDVSREKLGCTIGSGSGLGLVVEVSRDWEVSREWEAGLGLGLVVELSRE